ncbi:phage tail protein [Microbulbifer thermotolerans]|uniref:Phage tail protein n=1 Tax=Microbulbifer thermotolerans TaxID=252514 RepID=A0AB35HZF8_MICTH|nr:phage tail protein [Microbulbifer thermotolerans]MCX2802249.1 phage tail protein [Microbulbifer thermotolerans]
MLTIHSDLAKLERKLGSLGSGIVPRAASQAINRTIRSVNSVAVKAEATDTGVKQKEIREAHRLYLANRNKLQAAIDAYRARAKNLIEFVRPSQRKPNYFNSRDRRGRYKSAGVRAKAWGKTKTYRGTFIQQVRNGKLLVLKRKPAGPRGGTTEGVVGPSPRNVFASNRLQEIMKRRAQERLSIELSRSISNEIRKLK